MTSESGTESLVKLMLMRVGVQFAQQVRIDRVGRVDFLVGEHLVIEVDSKAHHSDPLRDRARDARLSVLGFPRPALQLLQVVRAGGGGRRHSRRDCRRDHR